MEPYGGNPAGFLLSADGKKVYLACDTGLFGDMSLIGEEGIDLAALPIGDNYTMGPDDALRAVKLIQPKHVVPVHYNTWDLIAADAAAWAKRVEAETSDESPRHQARRKCDDLARQKTGVLHHRAGITIPTGEPRSCLLLVTLLVTLHCFAVAGTKMLNGNGLYFSTALRYCPFQPPSA